MSHRENISRIVKFCSASRKDISHSNIFGSHREKVFRILIFYLRTGVFRVASEYFSSHRDFHFLFPINAQMFSAPIAVSVTILPFSSTKTAEGVPNIPNFSDVL